MTVPHPPPVTQTAFGPIFIVAVEQFTPPAQRLVHDRIARQFLPGTAQFTLAACRLPPVRHQLVRWSDHRFPGLWGGLLCRKRYGDDQFALALHQGIRQIVSLGAGLDTRPYRHMAESLGRTFEVDLPANSAYKQRRLRAIFGGVPDHVVLVPLDFESADLSSSLDAHGYLAEAPTLFVWEAVSQYLTEHGVRRILASLGRAAHGSRLIFTYVQRDFVDGANMFGCQALYNQFLSKQRMWHFGLRPVDVSPLLAEFGWHEREQVGRAEYLRRYVEPLGRRLRVTDVERFVLTEKT
jgi:methyltransferase (TIGR00027 family)